VLSWGLLTKQIVYFFVDFNFIVKSVPRPHWPRIDAIRSAHDSAKETTSGHILSTSVGTRQNSRLWRFVCILVRKVQQGREARVDVASHHWVLAALLSDDLLDACFEVALGYSLHSIAEVLSFKQVAEYISVDADILAEIADLSSDSDTLLNLLVELLTRLHIVMLQDHRDCERHRINRVHIMAIVVRALYRVNLLDPISEKHPVAR